MPTRAEHDTKEREATAIQRVARRRALVALAVILLGLLSIGTTACLGAFPYGSGAETVEGKLVSVRFAMPFDPGSGALEVVEVTGLTVDTEDYGIVEVEISDEEAGSLPETLSEGQGVTIERTDADGLWRFVSIER